MSDIKDIIQARLQRTLGDKIKYIHSADFNPIMSRWSINWVDWSGAMWNIMINSELVASYADSFIYSNNVATKQKDPFVYKEDNKLSKCSRFLWK